ncbi:hypothetical protein [Pseudomonas sp. MWU16-30317]|uniref:hypothetical protein n=1 Tax=Pseudomonas sp. MWU16-30317 TaxID=2878095 RepID=UPI001CFBEEB7|nr:hypothetical protein [Pseudomonas sp. MWU16-30317]
MKIFVTAIVLLGMAVIAFAVSGERKPLPTQAAEAIQPLATEFSKTVSKGVNDYLAGTSGPLGDAARRNQQAGAMAVAQPVRGTRKTMAQCLKPRDLIDQDVKECIDGTRVRDW